MTRINIGINPANLTDQHLLAEFKELPRIVTYALKRNSFDDIPPRFTLGVGHVKFFFNKLHYLHKRYLSLIEELIKRKMVLNQIMIDSINFSFNHNLLYYLASLYNDYTPTEYDITLIKSRISERILSSKIEPRYYKQTISRQKAIEILNKN